MKELYKVEYVGGIKIEDLDPVGYKITFYLDNPYVGLNIIADLPDDEFIPYIREELRKRKLHKTKYFKTIKIYP